VAQIVTAPHLHFPIVPVGLVRFAQALLNAAISPRHQYVTAPQVVSNVHQTPIVTPTLQLLTAKANHVLDARQVVFAVVKPQAPHHSAQLLANVLNAFLLEIAATLLIALTEPARIALATLIAAVQCQPRPLFASQDIVLHALLMEIVQILTLMFACLTLDALNAASLCHVVTLQSQFACPRISVDVIQMGIVRRLMLLIVTLEVMSV